MLKSDVTQATQLISDLRQRSQDSVFFVGSALLGFNRLTQHLHYEMAQVVQNASDYHRLLGLVPRDHYKTSIWTISYGVWRALKNPNETGLIVMNTAKNAERVVGKIRGSFESAPFLRQLYPELHPELSNRWNKEEACLPRQIDWPEATWTAAGWDTKVTSGHFDWIVFDDLVDEETYESPELMHKLNSRFEQREGLLRPPIEERDIIVVGNHWSNIDLASYIIEKHPEYRVYYRQAIEGGLPIFPEMYSLKWLHQKQEADPYVFATQWMNDPVDATIAELKKAWIKYYTRDNDGVILPDGEKVYFRQMNIYGALDPRHSLSHGRVEKLGSRNAITICGIDHKSRRYLLEEWAKRCDPVETLRALLDIWNRWREHGLLKIGIEAYGFQESLAPLADEIWKNEPYKPVVEPLKKDTVRSKENRIRSGTQFFRTGQAYIHFDHSDFKEEFGFFPGGKTKDLLDAWTWCMFLMTPPTEEAVYASEDVMDMQNLRALTTGAAI